MFPITYRHQFNYTVQSDNRWIAGMVRAQLIATLKKKGGRESHDRRYAHADSSVQAKPIASR
jgi:hypothetical protein